MMRVVVSGATGFLGGRLSRILKARGFEVVGLGRDRDLGNALANDGISFVPVDLGVAPTPQLSRLIGSAQGFVHAAALSSAWGPDAAFERANVTGTRTALALAEAAGAQRFVFVSSPSVNFRFADQLRQREDQPFPRPVNAYAASKQKAEREVLARPMVSPIVLRPRAIYGRGDVALLPRLIRAATRGPIPMLRGGGARTNLTHVDDVAEAIAAALLASASCGGRVFNVAGSEDLLVRHVVERAASKAGIGVRWRAMPWPIARAGVRLLEAGARFLPGQPEPPITVFGLGLLAFTQTLDIDSARVDLGFMPTISFEEGLARTFDGTSSR